MWPRSLSHLLSMAAFTPWWLRWIIVTETPWSAQLEELLYGPYIKSLPNPAYRWILTTVNYAVMKTGITHSIGYLYWQIHPIMGQAQCAFEYSISNMFTYNCLFPTYSSLDLKSAKTFLNSEFFFLFFGLQKIKVHSVLKNMALGGW